MNIFPFKREGRYGYANHLGEIVIASVFKRAERNLGDFALAESETGEAILIHARTLDRKFLRDTKLEGDEFHFGFVSAKRTHGPLVGYVDTSGQFAIEPTFSRASVFDCGGATVQYPGDQNYYRVDREGNRRGQAWLSITPFHPNGRFSGATFDWYGQGRTVIDGEGNRVTGRAFRYVWREHEGLIPVQITESSVGWLNTHGELIQEFEAEKIGNNFQNGVIPVKEIDGQWGLMDVSAHWTLEPKFDFIEGIGEDRYAMGYMDKQGDWQVQLCDPTGLKISESVFDSFDFFEDGWCRVWRLDYFQGLDKEPRLHFNFIHRSGRLLNVLDRWE
jgi:hypothetical protein